MTMILKGKPVADSILEGVRAKNAALAEKGIKITGAVVRFGENKDDIAYERSIIKKADEAGIVVKSYTLPENASQAEAEELVENLSSNPEISGILIFKPLPKHLNEERLFSKLAKEKDIDGATPLSMAALYSGDENAFFPCTALACMEMLRFYGIDAAGKNAVVIGRSSVIGKPAAMLLLKENATVTICHSKTKDIEEISRNADILVCALGRGEAITREYMSEKQVILDVGINFNTEGKMVGDVKYSDAEGFAGAVTPVPGGIGSITTACLLMQLARAAEKINA